MNPLTALAAADPVQDYVIPYDERLLADIVATPRVATRRKRRRGVVVAAWLSAILVPVAGVGAAGAAGIIPDGAKAAFPWEQGGPDTRMDLTTATRVFTQPGPGGTRFDVWRAFSAHGYECLSFNFPPEDAGLGVPASLSSNAGDSCWQPEGAPTSFPQGGGGTGGNLQQPTTFAMLAGPAVRATLTLAGVVTPVEIQNGIAAGWLPAGLQTKGATVTGYAADASVVGTSNVGFDPPP